MFLSAFCFVWQMLMRWSNDRLKATVHKVEGPPNHQGSDTVPERYSIAFFCNANKDVELKCLDSCCCDDMPARYPPINAHQYITQRLAETIITATPPQWVKKPQWLVEEITSTPQSDNVLADDNSKHGTSTTFLTSSCGVCQQKEAKYTCPRCQLPYCSIDCYRNHNKNSNNDDDSSDGRRVNNSCTEEFYKTKVNAILALERLENHQSHLDMLNRQYQQEALGNTVDAEDYATEMIAEEELFQLWSKLEELGEDATPAELDKFITPLLRNKFQQDLQQGNAQQLVLKDWFPWWKTQLVMGSHEDVNQENTEDLTGNPQKTLDDRLLETPLFESLSKGRPPSPVLLFNLVNVLYSSCSTLRLYHGVINACVNAPIEAATTLIADSAVLSRDARFTSLTEVLVCCTQGGKRDTTAVTAPWHVLVEDVAMLITSHRLVGRALLESLDILGAARKETKRKSEILSTKEDNKQHKHNTELIKQLSVLRKKLQYLLSWSQHKMIQTLLEKTKLKDDILSWKKEWTIRYEKEEEEEVVAQFRIS
jgi:hypothetical protein